MIVTGDPFLHVLNFSRTDAFELSCIASLTGLRGLGTFIWLSLLVTGTTWLHANRGTLKHLACVITFAIGSRIDLTFGIRLEQTGIRSDCLTVFGLVLSRRGHIRNHFCGGRGEGTRRSEEHHAGPP